MMKDLDVKLDLMKTFRVPAVNLTDFLQFAVDIISIESCNDTSTSFYDWFM